MGSDSTRVTAARDVEPTGDAETLQQWHVTTGASPIDAASFAPRDTGLVDLGTAALALAVTGLLDIIVAVLVGEMGVWVLARGVGVAVTSILAAATAARAGPSRDVVALAAVGTIAAQALSLVAAPLGDEALVAAVTIGSGVVASLATAWGAVRR